MTMTSTTVDALLGELDALDSEVADLVSARAEIDRELCAARDARRTVLRQLADLDVVPEYA